MAMDQSLANALFGALIVLCGLLLFMEVRHPYNKVAAKVLRQSHATNTSAFLFNNVIMSILSVSSLLVVAAQYFAVRPPRWLSRRRREMGGVIRLDGFL